MREAEADGGAPQPTAARAQRRHGDVLVLDALFGGWRVWCVETIALVTLLVLADAILLGGSLYAGVAPHPFWIPIVLVSAQYGVIAGAFSVAVASAALIFFGPNAFTGDDFYTAALAFAFKPTLWLGAALLVGGVRTLSRFQALGLTQSFADSRADNALLARALRDALAEVERLERRAAGETRTLAAVARAFADINPADEAALARSAEQIASTLAGPSQIYLRHGRTLVGRDGATPLPQAFADAVLAAGPIDPPPLAPLGFLCAMLRDHRGAPIGVLLVESSGEESRALQARVQHAARGVSALLAALPRSWSESEAA